MIVTYNANPESTLTLRSLSESLQQVKGLSCRIVVYDNSDPRTFTAPLGVGNCIVHSSGSNRGLAKSYNDALRYCEAVSASVLVTLDQDSRITPEYLAVLREMAPHMRDPVVALCPRIVSYDRVISPVIVSRFGRRTFGRVGRDASALNSFSAYSVRFLRSLGGFDEFYWLDCLDLATYAEIARRGRSVGLMDVVVYHDLSLLSGSVSRSRLVNIAYYESCFLIEYAGAIKVMCGIARLLGRAIRVAPAGARIDFLLAAMRAVTAGGRAGWRRSSRVKS